MQTACIASGSALPAATLLEGCLGPVEAKGAPAPVVPLVSAFEPTSTTAIVHVYAADGDVVDITVTAAGNGDPSIVTAIPREDTCIALRLSGLTPNTEYLYRASVDGGPRREGRLRTAPPADERVPFSFLFFADFNPSRTFDSPILSAMERTPASFAISLGDFPYSDATPAAITLADYEAKHLEARQHAGMQRFLRRAPLIAIWDDHEIVNDWDADDDPIRVAAGMTAWHRWFPLDGATFRKHRWGQLAEIFVLDARSRRSPSAALDDDEKTLLGVDQRTWLLEEITASTATFKIVVSSVALEFGTTGRDSWLGFLTERDGILDTIADAEVPGVVFLSADQHWFGSYVHRFGVRTFQTGPIASGIRVPPPLQPGILHLEPTLNFGEVTIDTDETLRVRGRDANGAIFYEEALTVDDLTPKR